MLWGRAASRCSLPTCRIELVIDPIETDDPSLVGEAAHIVGEKQGSARWDSALTDAQREKYANLILLCNVHHKLVDDHEKDFPIEKLRQLKSEHENWVRSSLTTFNAEEQRTKELWATYVDEWVAKAHIENWLEDNYPLLQPTPAVDKSFFEDLKALRHWILSRVWPEGRDELRDSLKNFAIVLDDLVNLFEVHAKEWGDGEALRTESFYNHERVSETDYYILENRFYYHVDLVHDLVYEATRAANFICDQVRRHLDRSFRIEEGVLLVREGMDITLKEHTRRLEYKLTERTSFPYPGLKEFKHLRATRDFHIGSGDDPTVEDFDFSE